MMKLWESVRYVTNYGKLPWAVSYLSDNGDHHSVFVGYEEQSKADGGKPRHLMSLNLDDDIHFEVELEDHSWANIGDSIYSQEFPLLYETVVQVLDDAKKRWDYPDGWTLRKNSMFKLLFGSFIPYHRSCFCFRGHKFVINNKPGDLSEAIMDFAEYVNGNYIWLGCVRYQETSIGPGGISDGLFSIFDDLSREIYEFKDSDEITGTGLLPSVVQDILETIEHSERRIRGKIVPIHPSMVYVRNMFNCIDYSRKQYTFQLGMYPTVKDLPPDTRFIVEKENSSCFYIRTEDDDSVKLCVEFDPKYQDATISRISYDPAGCVSVSCSFDSDPRDLCKAIEDGEMVPIVFEGAMINRIRQ